MDIKELYQIYLRHPHIQTDTRKLKQGDIFVALKGPNFNGNDYAKTALDAGASYCIADEDTGFKDPRVIKVEDGLKALQDLALHHRQQFRIPFIAITGSNGKTTTKELVHAVLSSTYTTYTTVGNLNNHIGIPLTILSIRPDAEIAIIEMGANHQKEIAGYCVYALPTHGLITNCGKAHLEGFGGIEGVRKGKGELYDYLREHKGTAFVNWDYDYLRDMCRGIEHIVRYGSDAGDEGLYVAGDVSSSDPFLSVGMSKGCQHIKTINTKLVGDYNLPNVLTAVAVGKFFQVPESRIQAALEQYEATNSRSQLMQKGSNRVILDAYNANPNSMKAAIENFARMEGGRKVLILGAMMELGADSHAEHLKLVNLIRQYSWKEVVLVGADFADVADGYLHFNQTREAVDWFKQSGIENSLILLKGSRSMQMEKLLD